MTLALRGRGTTAAARALSLGPRGQTIELDDGTELRSVIAYTRFGITIARTKSFGMEVAHRLEGMVARYLPTSHRIFGNKALPQITRLRLADALPLTSIVCGAGSWLPLAAVLAATVRRNEDASAEKNRVELQERE